MAARGHWLEAACQSSLDILAKRGGTCIQKIATPASLNPRGEFYQTRSTVDYVGVHEGFALAFDAKATRLGILQNRNVHQHQLDYLRAFTKAGGIGALLVAFDNRGGGSFLCSVGWYDAVKAEIPDRKSVPYQRFQIAANSPDERCYALHHGDAGMPIPLHLGFMQLIQTR